MSVKFCNNLTHQVEICSSLLTPRVEPSVDEEAKIMRFLGEHQWQFLVDATLVYIQGYRCVRDFVVPRRTH
jgi:hypothetical protein